MSIATRVVQGAAAGLLGGLVAAAAMSIAHKAMSARAKPETANAPKEEDSTIKVASALARGVGLSLAPEDKATAGTLVHYGFGAMTGAVYGAMAEVAPAVRRGAGVPFGGAVWLGAHVITVPALGLAKPPTEQPLATELVELVLHFVYGLVTEAIRRTLRPE